MDDMIHCAKIAVYCIENDLERIKQGEPKYYGFCFYVKRDEVNHMVEFVKETLDIFEVPYESVEIYSSFDLPVTKIWGKEKIIKAIKRDRDYLIKKSQSKTK